jgi:hypothetical protein
MQALPSVPMDADRVGSHAFQPGDRARLRLGPALLDLVSSAMLGIGLVSLAMPFFLYWLIHGDSDRYIWLINGPSPFDEFGSGPFQVFMYLGFFAMGTGLVSAGAALRLAPRRPEYAVGIGALAIVVVLIGGFFVVVALEGPG